MACWIALRFLFKLCRSRLWRVGNYLQVLRSHCALPRPRKRSGWAPSVTWQSLISDWEHLAATKYIHGNVWESALLAQGSGNHCGHYHQPASRVAVRSHVRSLAADGWRSCARAWRVRHVSNSIDPVGRR